jgi:hypothetical protein
MRTKNRDIKKLFRIPFVMLSPLAQHVPIGQVSNPGIRQGTVVALREGEGDSLEGEEYGGEDEDEEEGIGNETSSSSQI